MQVEEQLRRFDPAVVRPVLPGGDVSYVVDDTEVGRMLFALRPGGALVASVFVPDDGSEAKVLDRLARTVSPRVLRSAPDLDAFRHEFDDYVTGRREHFDVPVEHVLSNPFQREVLTRLSADIGYGRTTTYGALAASVGHPKAARAVGAALGANPLCVVVPCHRVVAASGSLTGYAGGLAVKRRLLALERGEAQG
jgi:methylated-DNA-[protein]-cysteine S-methyltransferase